MRLGRGLPGAGGPGAGGLGGLAISLPGVNAFTLSVLCRYWFMDVRVLEVQYSIVPMLAWFKAGLWVTGVFCEVVSEG